MIAQRKAWLDFGKGCSMLMVVLFHCEAYLPLESTSVSDLFMLFFMPFFFFLSGYLFTADPLQFSLRRKLKQILRGIVWTYLLFTTAITIPKYIISGEPMTEGFLNILLGRASWFIVALGGSQMMFAVLVRYCKDRRAYALFMFASLLAGWVMKCMGWMWLPYCLDSTLVVNFYFGLGMFYRWNEQRVECIVAPCWRNFVVLATLFYTLQWLDGRWLHTCEALFNISDHTNFPLAVAYSLVGIAMMTIFSKKLCQPRAVRFVGRNSLVFYYLNGGVIRAMVFVLNSLGLTALFQGAPTLRYVFLLLLVCCSVAALSLVAVVIRRHAPLLIGDKESFHRWGSRLGI